MVKLCRMASMIDIEKLSNNISTKIQIERVKQNLSQEKLAELAGISRSAVSSIELENSSPTIETLAKIANAFNLSLEEFFKFNF